MQRIFFFGNCQALSLAIYFTELLKDKNITVIWIMYDEIFRQYLGDWTRTIESNRTINKCNIITDNKPLDTYNISNNDIVIYQHIMESTSKNYNYKEIEKYNWKKVKIPGIYYDIDNQKTIEEMQRREIEHKIDIKITKWIENNKYRTIFITKNHPTTKTFIYVAKEILNIIKDYICEYDEFFFNSIKYNCKNYTELP